MNWTEIKHTCVDWFQSLRAKLGTLWKKTEGLRMKLSALWARLESWWQRFVERYEAQQEVIKKQSEISHERITIKRAVLSFMETWGLGSRNIFYTMWHLLWRPGYMIGDYLNGRRKKYLQPFFMFFVLTLILVQMAFLLKVQMPKNKDMTLTAYEFLRDHQNTFSAEQRMTIIKTAKWLDVVHDWRDENRGWDILIQSLGIVFATWLLWRKSPRIGTGEWVVENGEYIEGYNFAEIVTVIAYILCQLQILSLITMLLFHRLPFDHMSGLTMIVPKLILFVVLMIDFKQLFQRKWWPTIWRTFIIVLFV